mmetsp:Transcript_45861/g.121784  ORF Transcript_45861/g.121784 Transcript_45861/m.121784 type:complete len:114 (+) Transcript_45861:41-382(+)
MTMEESRCRPQTAAASSRQRAASEEIIGAVLSFDDHPLAVRELVFSYSSNSKLFGEMREYGGPLPPPIPFSMEEDASHVTHSKELVRAYMTRHHFLVGLEMHCEKDDYYESAV